MKMLIRFLTLFLALWLTGLAPAAAEDEFVPRRIIGLLQPLAEPLKLHPMHELAEMPLNHMGYVIDYRVTTDGFPEDAVNDPEVAGVITWFQRQEMNDPDGFLNWAIRMVRAGKPFVILGYPGIGTLGGESNESTFRRAEELFDLIGFSYHAGFTEMTFDSEIVHRDPDLYDFERRMGGNVPPFEFYTATAEDAEVALRIRQRLSGRTSDLFIISPRGAMIQGDWRGGWVFYEDPVYFKRQWFVDPFELFERVFKPGVRPVPDATTLNGRRIYYSHIDGDGWRNVSLVRPFKKAQIYSSRVVMEAAIKPYPDLPITVGPIAADLHPEWSGDERAQQVARELFELPQVEMAHHTYSHPFQWGFFEDYSIEKEASFVRQYDKPSLDAWGVEVVKGGSKQAVTLKDAYSRPRGFGTLPFDLPLEFEGAADVVNQFAPPDKRVEMVLWSGDTSPTERMIRASREAGLLNLNGGDSRYDPEFPSVSYVPPVGFKTGGEQQIFASNSNENTYTDLWSGRYFGFRDLVHTLRNTERPRRLKPINIYYHMYTGERHNALNGLVANLDYVRTQRVAPIKASHFARIGQGFFSTRFQPDGHLAWRILERGSLQTIRFDNAESLMPDMTESEGVLGFNRHEGSLYIALDPAVDAPRIALLENGRSPLTPYIVESRWQLRDLRISDAEITFAAQGYGNGEMFWSGMADGEWLAEVAGPNGTKVKQSAVVAGGELRFDLPADAILPVQVTIRRTSGRDG